MKIEFVDLKRQNQKYKKFFLSAVHQVYKEASYIGGTHVEKFETQFARFLNRKYCIGLNSGTDALFFALLAYGIGPGDEVITAPNSYFSTAMVIEHTGAKVVFADIEPKTHTIDPLEIAKKITQKTRAIIPIHLYGQPADMNPILALARKYNLIIIEDCCQAHGSKYQNNLVPVCGTGAFSFYPGKNLGSFGDAGALVTDDEKIAEKVLLLRNDGAKEKYIHQIFGYKSRLDGLQAAVLTQKLTLLEGWNEKRRQHANIYSQLLADLSEITLPSETQYAHHVYHIYAIETPRRNELRQHLAQSGIATVIHYPIPIHLQLPYRKKGFQEKQYPITETKAHRLLSLPMFPELTKTEIQYVAKRIKVFFD